MVQLPLRTLCFDQDILLVLTMSSKCSPRGNLFASPSWFINTRVAVGMGIPMRIPIPMGMGWGWESDFPCGDPHMCILIWGFRYGSHMDSNMVPQMDHMETYNV